jgi:hypothetical protein
MIGGFLGAGKTTSILALAVTSVTRADLSTSSSGNRQRLLPLQLPDQGHPRVRIIIRHAETALSPPFTKFHANSRSAHILSFDDVFVCRVRIYLLGL